MIRKAVLAGFVVLFVSFLAAGAVAADGDNAAVSPSYFEGVWTGQWSGFYEPGIKQDITLTVEKGGKKGVFRVEYAWGLVQFRNRTTQAGSLKTRGVQQGDLLVVEWKTKGGDDRKITLQKESENKVKARIERGGTLSPNESPTSETYLTRK